MARFNKRAEPGSRVQAQRHEESTPFLRQGDSSVVREGSHDDDVSSEATNMTVGMEDDLTREQVQIMKARTMYNMVEHLDERTKLLFLTNAQCKQIGSSRSSLRKMFDALEIGRPQLVINLLESKGMRPFLRCISHEEFEAGNILDLAGFQHNKPPFLSQEEEDAVQSKIDLFMADVVVPLAVQTQAVILACAVPDECCLSASLTRVVSSQRAKWGQVLPFKILSLTNLGFMLYRNSDMGAFWRTVKRKSRAWLQHDAILNSLSIGSSARNIDLDSNAVTLIINDRLDTQKQTLDEAPWASLVTELLRMLAANLPSLAVRTGSTVKASSSVKGPGTLESSMAAALSGTPHVFLDLRKHPIPDSVLDRAALIEHAKQDFSRRCAELVDHGIIEALDCCTIAFFHEALFGDGNAATLDVNLEGGRGRSESLHKAIRRLQSNEIEAAHLPTLKRASSEQVREVADFIAERFFQDAWEMLSTSNKEKGASCQELYSEKKYAYAIRLNTLLASDHIYGASLWDLQATQRLIKHLVRLDRLPTSTKLEGLLLLRSAWNDYDVAMMLADRYKHISKILFALQLLLGWLVISLSNAWEMSCDGEDALFIPNALKYAPLMKKSIFVISALTTMIVSFDGLFNAKSRWHHLRTSACKLESIIWQYRTRVGDFSETAQQTLQDTAETKLMYHINEWRDELMAAANLNSTDFGKQHSAGTYKHFQETGEPVDGKDDFHSPAQPRSYIELRIEPAMALYRDRIPPYTWAGYLLKVCVVLLGMAATMLAHYDYESQVAVVMAASAAFTSWSEFSDNVTKVTRYSKSVVNLQKLLSWWDSLSEVQKASRDNISHLIETCEGVIAEERVAWTSAPQKSQAGGKSKDKAEAEGFHDDEVAQ